MVPDGGIVMEVLLESLEARRHEQVINTLRVPADIHSRRLPGTDRYPVCWYSPQQLMFFASSSDAGLRCTVLNGFVIVLFWVTSRELWVVDGV